MSEAAEIPLRDRRGQVRAVAIVDEADYAFLSQWRWCIGPAGYATRNIADPTKRSGRRAQFMHRVLLGIDGLSAKEVQGDHINLNRLDNRRLNLRTATHAENVHNRGSQRGSSSRFRGVAWNKRDRVWHAQVIVNGQKFWLGCFKSEEEAGQATAECRAKNMPFSPEALATRKTPESGELSRA